MRVRGIDEEQDFFNETLSSAADVACRVRLSP